MKHTSPQRLNSLPPASMVEFRCLYTWISMWEMCISFAEINSSILCPIGSGSAPILLLMNIVFPMGPVLGQAPVPGGDTWKIPELNIMVHQIEPFLFQAIRMCYSVLLSISAAFCTHGFLIFGFGLYNLWLLFPVWCFTSWLSWPSKSIYALNCLLS